MNLWASIILFETELMGKLIFYIFKDENTQIYVLFLIGQKGEKVMHILFVSSWQLINENKNEEKELEKQTNKVMIIVCSRVQDQNQ